MKTKRWENSFEKKTEVGEGVFKFKRGVQKPTKEGGYSKLRENAQVKEDCEDLSSSWGNRSMRPEKISRKRKTC